MADPATLADAGLIATLGLSVTDGYAVALSVALSAVFGGLGGSIFPLLHSGGMEIEAVDVRPITDLVRSLVRRFRAIGRSVWIGSVGSMGFLFIETSLGSITVPLNGNQTLRLIAVSVVAGFGARRLLPAMAQQLIKRVEKAEQKIEQTSQRLEQQTVVGSALEAEINELKDFKENVLLEGRFREIEENASKADDYPSLIPDTIALIEAGRASAQVIMYLARFFRRSNDYIKASKVLEALLNNSTVKISSGNRQRAYYNLACYYSLLGQQTGDMDQAQKSFASLTMALSDPKERVHLSRMAAGDSDLTWLKNNKDLSSLGLPASVAEAG